MTTLIQERFSLSEQSKVIIVHGAIRRRTTEVWMEALRSYLSTRGIPAECFCWSGIPAAFATRSASRKLIARLKELRERRVAIWCKSTGADVVNLAAAHVKPYAIVQVAPGFVASGELTPGARRVTVRLARDTFLEFWEKLRVVHRIPAGENPGHIIIGPAEIEHHDLNYDREVSLFDQRRVHLYALYAELLAAELTPSV
jgi:hypothetical protein